MDKNKLKVLQELGYEVRRVCGNCKHGVFPNDSWGTCSVHKYEHQKHCESTRQVSINKYGHCYTHEIDPLAIAVLDVYGLFLEKTK